MRITTLRCTVGSSTNRDTAVSTASRRYRIRASRIGDLVGRLDGLGRADRAAAQQVKRAVVRDPEQPGTQWRHLLQLVHGDEGPDEGVLHHILALDHRAHQARAVAVKLGPQLIGKRQEFGVARR